MSSFDVPVEFRRIYKGPLDPTVIFASLSELNNYLNDPTRYAGQIASVVDNNNIYIYQLNAAEDTWIPVITGDAAVLSVNNETGNITITPDTLNDSSTVNKFVTQAQINTLHTHNNKIILDSTEEAFTAELLNIINTLDSIIDGGTF